MSSLFNQKTSSNNTYKKDSLSSQWEKLKKSIFFLFHVSLNTVTKSSWGIFILLTFECLQCLSYSFILAFNHTWIVQEYTQIHYYLYNFFKLFLLTPYMIESSYYMYLIAYFGCVIFILSILCLLIYLVYLIYKKQILSKWHIILFDVIARYYSGIFLLPLLTTIIPIFYCEKFINENFKVHEGYCSSSEVIVYIILSAITLVPSIFFAILFSGFYFDIRMNKGNYLSKLSPRYDIWMVIIKVIVAFCFIFIDLGNDTNKIILAFMLMVFSIWLYAVIKLNILFYSMFTQKIYEIMVLILSVTNSLLFCDLGLLYFGFNYFDGLFELWCFSILFVILYKLYSGENYSKELPVECQDTSTPNEAIRGVLALMNIIQQRENNIEYEIILNGYIINHIPNCNNETCYLKVYKQSNFHLEFSTEGQNVLYQHLNDLFINYLIIFPSDMQLRIIYSLFALEVLGKVNICRINMYTAINYNPSFHQQFCLYRMNKIIEDDYLNIEDDSVNLHIASTIVFDQFFQKFQETMKSIGVKYLEFWTAFVQEETNMKKIKIIGNTILNLIHIVFDLWDKLQEINQNDYDCLRLYGQFQIDILNDKHFGEFFISRSNELLLTSGRQIKLFKNDLNHLCFDGSPVLIASQVLNKGLVISQVTNSFTHLFQYQKIELIGKDINMLLPVELREYHANVVKNFLIKNQSKKIIEKRKIKGIALNKLGFIFPVKFTMILLPNLTKESNIAIRIKQNKQIANYTCHIMINSLLDITNISSQAIKFINITEKGIWSIKNLKKIKPENRINIKYLIKEVNSTISGQSQFQNKPIPNQESSSLKDQTSIAIIGWREHDLLKKFKDEKNTYVHIYDFQQVYHLSHNEDNNAKTSYIATVISSQIDKNISLWNMLINEEYKGHSKNNNSNHYITANMNIFDIAFNQKPIGHYVIALDYVYQDVNEGHKIGKLLSFNTMSTHNLKMTGFLNKMTNLSDCRFQKSKVIKFDIENGVFAMETKEKGKTSTMITIVSPARTGYCYTNMHNNNEDKSSFMSSFEEESLQISAEENDQQHENKSIIKHRHHHPKLKPSLSRHHIKFDLGDNGEDGEDGEGNVYNSLFFHDYSESVLYYDLDPNTLTCSIFAKPTPIEGKRLAELTHFFENDTLKTDDDISNIKNSEESEYEKAKYDINKNYILKQKIYKEQKTTIRQVILSWIILLLHLILAISSLELYNDFLEKTKNNILCMNRIASLFNYTLTSTSYFIDTIIYHNILSMNINERIKLYYFTTEKLLWNAKVMYETLSITDLFLADTFNEINSTNSMNITMIVLISVDENNKPLTSENNLPFHEAVNYLMAAIQSLGSDPNINSDYFDPDGFFLSFNSINNYYLSTMDYLARIKAIVIQTREPKSNQLAIIYVSISLNIILLSILYLWISFTMRRMNSIIIEFLSIKQVEAQFITKNIERFLKNIRINHLEADEEEKEEDLELIDKKRNNKYIGDKMKRIQTEEIMMIFLVITAFIILLLYFLIQYLVISIFDEYSNQLSKLYFTLNEFIGNINLLSIGAKIRLVANEDITMLNEPINLMLFKQFDLLLVLKEKLIYDIQMNAKQSLNFTNMYNNDIALDILGFKRNASKLLIDSLEYLTFDYTVAYYYNTLLSFCSNTLRDNSKRNSLNDFGILYSNIIKDYVLMPYLTLVSNAAIVDCENYTKQMTSFVIIWFWVWSILLGIVFFCIWMPLLSRLEREVS